MSSSKIYTNKEQAIIDAAKKEGSENKKSINISTLRVLLIGAVFGLVFVLLQNGPLFRYEWTYGFYELFLTSIVLNLTLNQQSRVAQRAFFTALGYISAVVCLFFMFWWFGSGNLDVRSYLAEETTSILHKYDTVENEWREAFIDTYGYAYYENVDAEDISKILALNSNEIWNERILNKSSVSRLEWRPIGQQKLDSLQRQLTSKISHPDTLCSLSIGALCVNKTTGQVLFSYG